MSQRSYLNPPAWPAPPGYSHAVVTAGHRLLFVSGQVPIDGNGMLVGGTDFKAQARAAFENLRVVLALSGASFLDVIKLTYMVVGLDADRVLALREIRDEILPTGPRPASSLFGVAGLFRPDVEVEIEAIAEHPSS